MPSAAPPLKPVHWNREPLAHVRSLIAIASGKGGVGKSTTAVQLAHALTDQGKRVGILDADIQGPSIPRMLGIQNCGQPESKDGVLLPIVGHGIAALSMGNLSNDQAAIWRGPMVTKALVQMLRMVRWGTAEAPLDVLLIDMPPGTGDIHLTLMQQAPVNAAIIVTTAQEMATADAHKAMVMFEKIGIPILGVIENMSYFTDPSGQRHTIFGEGGGEALAARHGVPLLGAVPLDGALGRDVDEGKKQVAEAYRIVAKAISITA